MANSHFQLLLISLRHSISRSYYFRTAYFCIVSGANHTILVCPLCAVHFILHVFQKTVSGCKCVVAVASKPLSYTQHLWCDDVTKSDGHGTQCTRRHNFATIIATQYSRLYGREWQTKRLLSFIIH